MSEKSQPQPGIKKKHLLDRIEAHEGLLEEVCTRLTELSRHTRDRCDAQAKRLDVIDGAIQAITPILYKLQEQIDARDGAMSHTFLELYQQISGLGERVRVIEAGSTPIPQREDSSMEDLETLPTMYPRAEIIERHLGLAHPSNPQFDPFEGPRPERRRFGLVSVPSTRYPDPDLEAILAEEAEIQRVTDTLQARTLLMESRAHTLRACDPDEMPAGDMIRSDDYPEIPTTSEDA